MKFPLKKDMSPWVIICTILAIPLGFVISGLQFFFLQVLAKVIECNQNQLCTLHSSFFGFSQNIPANLKSLSALLVIFIFSRFLFQASVFLIAKRKLQALFKDLVTTLSRANVSHFQESSVTHSISVLTQDSREVTFSAVNVLATCVFSLADLFWVAVLASQDNFASVAMLIPFFLILFVFQIQFLKLLAKSEDVRTIHSRQFVADLVDFIRGLPLLRSFDRVPQLGVRVAATAAKYSRARHADTSVWQYGNFWVGIMAICYTAVIFLWLCFKSSTGSVGNAELVAIVTGVFRLSSSAFSLSFSFSNFGEIRSAASRIRDALAVEPESRSEDLRHLQSPSRILTQSVFNSAKHRHAGNQGLFVKNVSVSHAPTGQLALRDFTCMLRPQEQAVIMGRTGAGKSTLFSALLRLVSVHSGDILLNGNSIYQESSVQFRKRVCLVPQNGFVVDGTVRHNIDPNKSSHDVHLRRTLDKLGLDKIALDMVLETNGSNLSIGQRQLISVARAIVTKKEIVLFDEPSAHLDSDAERNISNIIKEDFRDSIVLVITHRESMASYFSKIINL